MRSRTSVVCLAAAASGVALLACLGSAQARGDRYPGSPYPSGIVVAESRWGHGTVSGTVRPGRNGWEVRTPGGNWIECKRSCSETLRQETVDIFERMNGLDRGPGYFRYERRF